MKTLISSLLTVILLLGITFNIDVMGKEVYTALEVSEALDGYVKTLERAKTSDDLDAIKMGLQEYVSAVIEGGDTEEAKSSLQAAIDLFQDITDEKKMEIITHICDTIISLTGPETIYSMDAGGFIITYGMRKQPFFKITLPASHNSHANNGDSDLTIVPFTKWELNHDTSIPEQMDAGIRKISFDLGLNYQLRHNGLGVGSTSKTLEKITDWVEDHPTQIIMIRIADVRWGSKDDAADYLNSLIKDTGLHKYVFNWVPQGSDGYCFKVGSNFTMGDVLRTGRNIIFNNCRTGEKPEGIESSYEGPLGVGTDSCYFKPFDYDDDDYKSYEHAEHLEEHSIHKILWAPDLIEKQHDEPNRSFGVSYSPENLTAADREKSRKNNAGQRIYQCLKAWENMFDTLGIPRGASKVSIEYAEKGGFRDVSLIDGINRLHYERFGYDWEDSPHFWEVEPFEFDDEVVDLIRGNSTIDVTLNGFASGGISAIKEEVDGVLQDIDNKMAMGASTNEGLIQADGHKRFDDWKTVPEFAFDGDLATRWKVSGNGDHWISIDLGAEHEVNAIAIAWEYADKVPKYDVEVSNNGQDWSQVLKIRKDNRIDSLHRFWDLRYFKQQTARYVRVKIHDATDSRFASMWEMKLYNVPEHKVKDLSKFDSNPHQFPILEDTYTRGGDYKELNYGTAGEAGNLLIKDTDSGNYDRKVFMKADLSGFSETVNACKLNFYVNHVEDSSRVKVRVYGIKEAHDFEWNEYELTAKKADENLDHYYQIGYVDIRSKGWYEVELDSDYIKDMIDEDGKITLLLRDKDNEEVAKSLSSSESEIEQPYIEIY